MPALAPVDGNVVGACAGILIVARATWTSGREPKNDDGFAPLSRLGAETRGGVFNPLSDGLSSWRGISGSDASANFGLSGSAIWGRGAGSGAVDTSAFTSGFVALTSSRVFLLISKMPCALTSISSKFVTMALNARPPWGGLSARSKTMPSANAPANAGKKCCCVRSIGV